ncbi:S26 family signal peptidase [Plantactinospora sp. GCM10030261]|uniref:S26 family signal peptidase n=1 Tax=Plantactinospora sp. GCM10030261 TaxID=3273420 RepID=UPI003609796F
MTAPLVGTVLLLLVVSLVALRRRVVLVTVTGLSMAPTFLPGDRLLVRRVPTGRIRRGDVIVLRVAETCRRGDSTGRRSAPWLVKRVAAVAGDPVPGVLPEWLRGPGVVAPATFVVLGDNAPLSRDSRQFGAVPATGVLGVVRCRIGRRSAPVGDRPRAGGRSATAEPQYAAGASPRPGD